MLRIDGDIFCLGKRNEFLRVNLRSYPYIMGCRLERWEDLMEYTVQVTGNS